MKPKKPLPELLAPAGNLLSAIVALDSGADAVYVGLQKFNARERAGNFSLENLSKLLCYARRGGKKVYVAFNTLIKEAELAVALPLLLDLAALGPDAVIVQDLGIVHMIRAFCPTLPVHASTQMGIHNSAGVELAAKMGIERVILERQVTRDELAGIMRRTSIEVEVFIHGALCCSLSGNCFFSSWLGAWSGNRGKCMQPCRRRFFTENGNGFFFSTCDLLTLDFIPELKKMGVASLKIEGRLKKPDYLKKVVRAYRIMLDAPENEAPAATLQKAKDALSGAIGRQGSSGFSSTHAFQDIIDPNKMGVSGLICGKVTRTARNGFTASVSRRIHVGDILRVQEYAGDKSTALAVGTIQVNGRQVQKAVKGDSCFIRCDRAVTAGATLYKTGESYDKMTAKLAALPLLRQKIDFTLTISAAGFLATLPAVPGAVWEKQQVIDPARKHALTPETVRREFAASSSDSLQAGQMKVEIQGDLFLPASLLKQARREFWDWVEENRPMDAGETDRTEIFTRFNALVHAPVTPLTAEEPPRGSVAETAPDERQITAPTFHFDGTEKEIVLPPFCPEEKLDELQKKVEQAARRGTAVFRLTSLYQLTLLTRVKKAKLRFSFPLPTCNSLAVRELCQLIETLPHPPRILSVQAWVELEEAAIQSFITHSPLTVEMITSGRIPLMTTRAEIPITGTIHDDRGAEYEVIKETESGITCLFSKKILRIPPLAKACPCSINLPDHPAEEVIETSFNFHRELL